MLNKKYAVPLVDWSKSRVQHPVKVGPRYVLTQDQLKRKALHAMDNEIKRLLSEKQKV